MHIFSILNVLTSLHSLAPLLFSFVLLLTCFGKPFSTYFFAEPLINLQNWSLHKSSCLFQCSKFVFPAILYFSSAVLSSKVVLYLHKFSVEAVVRNTQCGQKYEDPKVFEGVDGRALCRPVKILHIKTPFLHGAGFVFISHERFLYFLFSLCSFLWFQVGGAQLCFSVTISHI